MAADGPARVKLYRSRKERRSNFDSRWERMAPFLAPSRVGIISQRTPGTKQTTGVTDSTTLMAAELMAMFVAGHIINPSQQWGGMRLGNGNRPSDAIQEWLEECRDRMLAEFSNSMFYGEAPESLIDHGGFGTGCLGIEEMPEMSHLRVNGFRGFFTEAHKTGRFVIGEGPDGLIHEVTVEKEMTAGQLEKRFGKENLPPKAKKALAENKVDDCFQIIHDVYPRSLSEQEFASGAKKMPYASCWIDLESKHVIHEGGFRVFPKAIPRYHKTPGEVFGRGRGDIAFPDTWSINTAKTMGFEDWALKIKPPVMVRHDSVIGTLKLTPGGPTSINTHGQSIRDSIAPYETGSHPEVSQIKEEELRKSIRQIFFVDQILALMEVNKSEMTAFEFSKKIELLFRLMGPVYGRTEKEYLRRIWEIGFDIMWHANAFAPPPPEIFDTDGTIDVVFQNPIARAQRSADVESITMAVQDLAPLADRFPTVLDRFNPDKLSAHVFAVRGVPAIVTNNEDEMAAIAEARQQQLDSEQAISETGSIAESAGKVAPFLKAMQEGGVQ